MGKFTAIFPVVNQLIPIFGININQLMGKSSPFSIPPWAPAPATESSAQETHPEAQRRNPLDLWGKTERLLGRAFDSSF